MSRRLRFTGLSWGLEWLTLLAFPVHWCCLGVNNPQFQAKFDSTNRALAEVKKTINTYTHTRILQTDSDRWLNVRYRTFLRQPISSQKNKIAKFNMLVHAADIATDAWMFQEKKKLEEFQLFIPLYSCPVSIVHRLKTTT
ncbi:hypothetical protein P175DRAFT_0532872 [Aspergillus ochraceoroseus IBT 24754]|uniref:Uncharacterized protein n=1 Tax=Aspergillus ochraceoroseus IBT 24754 TaxID=1392256 RepID=A0A2T5LUF3_9EURO|nr:uncharacterized protein P175DRAFT_0532872 [Aspergillus ochraceoroseus IBT 24754]PTU19916.1 hypothetical protein P175DRAFT_0532872 [Aspergillus ochraceoroseus IBT 24754]